MAISNYTNIHMNFSIYSLITAIFVGGISGYLGSLMVTKKMSLVGDAMGHIALPGMGLALLFGHNVSLGAFAFLLLGVWVIWYLEPKTNLPTETLVGIIFVFSLAIGFFVTPDLELLEALFGDILKISTFDFWMAVSTSSIIFFGIRKIYPKLMLGFLSEDLAISNGINIKKYNFLYLLAIASIVALGVKVVGSLLVGALAIIPAAAARKISKNISQYTLFAGVIGALSCAIGTIVSNTYSLSAGPTVILVSISFFTVTLLLKNDVKTKISV